MQANTGDDSDTIRISAGLDTISGGDGADTFDAFSDNDSLDDEKIAVTVYAVGDGSTAKTGDGNTDSVDSIETFIADEASAEADSISLTEAGHQAVDISGIDDTATGTFTPSGGAPIAFGGVGQPTFSALLNGTSGIPGVGQKGFFQIDGGGETGQVGGISFENFENIDFSVVCFADGRLIKIRDWLRPVEASKALRAQAKQEIEAVFGAVPYPDRPLARLTPKGKKARHLVNRHVKNAKALYSNI